MSDDRKVSEPIKARAAASAKTQQERSAEGQVSKVEAAKKRPAPPK